MEMKKGSVNRFAALRIVGVYAIVAAAWIYLSDTTLALIVRDPEMMTRIAVLKGFLFIIVTGTLLYQMISRHLRKVTTIEQELRESRNLMNTLIEETPDAIYIKDRQGKYLLFNTAASNFTGISSQSAIGLDDSSIFPPAEAVVIMKGDRQVMETGRTSMYEECLTNVDGKQRVFLTTKGPIIDAAGKVSGLFGIARDITERREAEAVLRLNEERLKLAIAASKTGVWEWDINTNAIIWSQECYSIYDVPPGSDLSFDTFLRLVHPADQPIISRMIQDAIRTRQVVSAEYRVSLPDGRLIWIFDLGQVMFDTSGKPDRMVGIIRDITEKKNSEEQLKKSEERYRTLFNLTPGSILLEDQDGVILEANDSLCATFGYSRDDLVGKPVDILVPPDRRRGIREHIDTILTGTILAHEVENVSISGQVHLMELRETRVPLPDGRMGILVAANDVTERRKAEEALRESEERYRKLISTSPDAITVMDQEGKITFASAKALEIFGHSPLENVLGRHVTEWVVDEDRTALIESLQNFLTTGKIDKNEYRLRRGTDAVFIGEINVAPIQSPDGKIRGAIIVTRDVTDRKRADDRIRMLAHTIESIGEAVSITDIENRILYVNKAFCSIYGYREDELIGESIEIVRSPNDRVTTVPTILGSTKKGGWSGELLNRRKDGSEFIAYLATSVVQNDQGNAVALVGVAQDVTDRKNAELELRQTRDHLQRLLDSSPAVIYSLSCSDGHPVTYVSENIKSQFGIEVADILTHPDLWITSIHPDDRDRMQKEQKSLSELGQLTQEYRLKVKNGEYRWIRDQRRLVFDDAGKPLEIVGFWVDIHETKILEKQFLRAQRMESIGTLAGGIAHDLNNVLSPIMMGIGVLEHKYNDDSTREILEMLSASVERGAEMVKQVLSFARGIGGENRLLTIRPLIREVQKILRETFPKSVDFITDVPEDLWPVSGDPTHLHQVIINLCVNARDAMPDGGTLEINAINLMADEHFTRTHIDAKAGPYVVITVSDTGHGISPGVIDKIFDPFFTTKEVGKGTGLGLSTALSIVKSHGGFIAVASSLGKGTSFKIYLPALRASDIGPVNRRPPALTAGDGSVILVVDDEEAVREVTRTMLETFGYTVLTACDGAEAVALYPAKMKEIALVITDMMMPAMDGAATIRALQKMNPGVRIVAVSGLAHADIPPSVPGARTVPFLLKPYNAERLLTMVKKMLTS
jgi:PAS domain S-box-containing protein